jgi:hypothetical protein
MILGMSIQSFTELHVVISLIGIISGLIVLYGMFSSQRMSGWTALFLATTIFTSVTGFLFPGAGFTPAQRVGFLSLAALAVMLLALYFFHLARAWRWIYVASYGSPEAMKVVNTTPPTDRSVIGRRLNWNSRQLIRKAEV